MQNQYYSLAEIASWQLEVKTVTQTKITLPSLQRGFVWKPYQMEALWDSILRGYPIGSILMASNGGTNKFLLDGQQRCTTIALGFYNPFNNIEQPDSFFSIKDYLPSIWIDLLPENDFAENYRYAIRVLNRSHPWGYQQKHNNKTLTMEDRQKALLHYKTKQTNLQRYTDLNPSYINPWDARYPVPLSFLLNIEAENVNEFTMELKRKTSRLSIKTKHSRDQLVDFEALNADNLTYIFEGIKIAQNLKLPEIYVSENALKEENGNEPDSQDPTLFVRLNSAGTPLTGEELIYSIFKAAYPNSKDLVEKIGVDYISPRKIINIFSRLAMVEKNKYSHFPTEFTIRTFRNALNDMEFKKNLNEYVKLAERGHAQRLINFAVKILQQRDADFPPVVIKQLIVSNNDLFLLLLIYIEKYHLYESNDLDPDIIKDISSAYVHVLWFGRDKKIAHKLFAKLKLNDSLNNNRIRWREAVHEIIEENPDHILKLIEPEEWRDILSELVIKEKINHRNYVNRETKPAIYDKIKMLVVSKEHWDNEALVRVMWDDFLGKIYWNRTMLLYAQRDYINRKFQDYNQFESIDDTNRPWDWDHIYPISWVYNKNNIHPLVKSWVNSIGNLRALSYDDNRSESNKESPKERLSKETDRKQESFVLENDGEFWDKLENKHNRIIENGNGDDLYFYLCAIVNRTVNIYEEWYERYYRFNEN